MKLIKLIVVFIVIGLISIYGFVQSGLFNVAATMEDGPLLTWLMHTTMEKSLEKRARNIEPPDLGNREMILAGASDYVGMCAQCHGEPGKQPGIIRQGLNPAPPDLKSLTEGVAAEQFWVVTNGIRMAGMPAFGKTHEPDEIWPVVAFLQSARDLSATDYNRLVEESKGYGHHAHEEGYEHEGHSHDHPASNASDSASSDVEMSPASHEEHLPDAEHAHSHDPGEHSH